MNALADMVAIVDGVDALATAMETKWGRGRLRLLVTDDLRSRFDQQHHAWGEACQTYTLEEIRRQGDAMRRAWSALDKAATEAGATPLEPSVWETRLDDGTVLALCRDVASAFTQSDNRRVEVWTLDEVARFISTQREVREVKKLFPGSLVTDVRSTRGPDPNDDIPF